LGMNSRLASMDQFGIYELMSLMYACIWGR